MYPHFIEKICYFNEYCRHNVLKIDNIKLLLTFREAQKDLNKSKQLRNKEKINKKLGKILKTTHKEKKNSQRIYPIYVSIHENDFVKILWHL